MKVKKILKALPIPDRPNFLSALVKEGRLWSSGINFIRRSLRDRKLWATSKNFLEFYARVVDDEASHKNPEFAIGSNSQDHWIEVGLFQFNFLASHGLRPDSKFLDIGCGNLRLGAQIIPYLDEYGYVGIDISPKIVTAACSTIQKSQLQNKFPRIFLVAETNYGFLPESYFDITNAHSVFSHLPAEEIEKVMRESFRVLKPGGWFDFTFNNRAEESNYLREDFCFPASKLLDMASSCGFQPYLMTDWSYPQDKIRAVKPI